MACEPQQQQPPAASQSLASTPSCCPSASAAASSSKGGRRRGLMAPAAGVAAALLLMGNGAEAFMLGLPRRQAGAAAGGSALAARQRATTGSRADWGANAGAALLFTGRRPAQRSQQSTSRLFSAAAAAGVPPSSDGADAAAAAAAAKVMAEVNAGMKEALPQLNSVLSKKIPFGKRYITPIGTFILASVFFWVGIFYPFLISAALLSYITDGGKKMRPVDWVVHWWSHVTMRFIGYKPKVVGLENLPPIDETVVYVPNHTSFLDILTLSGFIPRPFKYISKIEILRIPFIGWAMRISKHIAIRRASKASQLKMVQQSIRHLKNGNSLVTFAEGTRSKTGHLQSFKKGAFRIAKEAGVRIVPISICNLHKWMPTGALVPLGVPSDVVIKIHPPVETKDRNENIVWREVFETVNEGLPEYQRYPTSDAPASS